jgi:hypothetical protein
VQLTVGLIVHREVGKHALDLAELARLEHVLNGVRDGLETRPDGLHEEELLLGRDGDQLVELGQVKGEGLLAEDVLACQESGFGVGVVEGVRGADVDGVDVLRVSGRPDNGMMRCGIVLAASFMPCELFCRDTQ